MKIKYSNNYGDKKITSDLFDIITKDVDSDHDYGKIERIEAKVESILKFCETTVTLLYSKGILTKDDIYELIKPYIYELDKNSIEIISDEKPRIKIPQLNEEALQSEIQLRKFHLKYRDPELFKEFVAKVIEKYDSDDYKKRWKGNEAPEDLFWFLFDYAEKYGRKCNENELANYGNCFTTDLYFINGYYFNKMNGLGSAVLVEKKKRDEKNA